MAVNKEKATKPEGFVDVVLCIIFEAETLPGRATGPRTKEYPEQCFQIEVSRTIVNVDPKLHDKIMKLKQDKEFFTLVQNAFEMQTRKFKYRNEKNEEKITEASDQLKKLSKEIYDLVFKKEDGERFH